MCYAKRSQYIAGNLVPWVSDSVQPKQHPCIEHRTSSIKHRTCTVAHSLGTLSHQRCAKHCSKGSRDTQSTLGRSFYIHLSHCPHGGDGRWSDSTEDYSFTRVKLELNIKNVQTNEPKNDEMRSSDHTRLPGNKRLLLPLLVRRLPCRVVFSSDQTTTLSAFSDAHICSHQYCIRCQRNIDPCA